MSTDNLDRIVKDTMKILDDWVRWDYRSAYRKLSARAPLPSEVKNKPYKRPKW